MWYVSRERPITPRAMADVNGDGVKDPLVFRPATGMIDRWAVGYHDGKDIRRDESGQLYARGFPTQLNETLLEDGHNYQGQGRITFRRFEDNPRLDMVIRVPDAEDQVFSDISSRVPQLAR